MIVICESCRKQFEMTQEMLKEKYLGAMYTESYYICPCCGKKYIVAIMNSKCRKLRKELMIDEYKKELDRINGK
ncbi:hypothetical protein HF846_04085 [Clostridium cadaveris]|uniref:Uncharacterized protein n=1 Tax=Clostridium cadaveris TaxID=1529 RepID=A0A316LZQ3_9CLOT|nr:hypothetical protein [Clostridium cadaveris]MDM8310825.1 hypothetical protein [Clostridium cadaveris]MDU4953767.1 hypothetical protein [Clostridium sp.]NME63780.1 hypothetical protein [Clostridium cadaveris]PWL51772.1 MAG: hypothetical protein DBY38_12565 [Clostridium cadaveris]